MIPTLGNLTDAYLGELARRGRTKATRQKYREVLWPFADHCHDKLVHDVTADDCRGFLDRWVDASPSTVALYVSILRGLFDYARDESLIDRSPMERIKRPRRKRPEDLDVVTISSDDAKRLLVAAADEWDDLLGIATLLYLGPRRSAAAQLRRRDLDLGRGVVRFREKGGKVSVKPLPGELAAIYQAAEDAGLWVGPDDYVIPNRRRARSGQRSNKIIYAIVKRVAARARVNVHPHALRAAFAVEFDDQNPQSIWALKELLGHARIETTLVYLRRKDRARALEQVRGLSWGAPAFPSQAQPVTGGLEPVFEEHGVPEPIRRKLDELRARSGSRRRAPSG